MLQQKRFEEDADEEVKVFSSVSDHQALSGSQVRMGGRMGS